MCESCWEEYGSPAIDTPAVREAAALVTSLYEIERVGGAAHVVTDDWNLEDTHVDWCLAQPHDGWGTSEGHVAARAVLVALKALSLEERASALGLSGGYWEIPSVSRL